MTVWTRIVKANSATLVLASFLLAIAVGPLLLKLPLSSKIGFISWVNKGVSHGK
jgi:predicted membrane-bound dolichyl-phosphate-mannose-protein mannosyltransferase